MVSQSNYYPYNPTEQAHVTLSLAGLRYFLVSSAECSVIATAKINHPHLCFLPYLLLCILTSHLQRGAPIPPPLVQFCLARTAISQETRTDAGLGTAAGRASRAAGAVWLLVLLLRRDLPGDIFVLLSPLLLLYFRELLRAGVRWPTRASRPFWWSARSSRWSTWSIWRPSRWTSTLLISLRCKSSYLTDRWTDM
ncbi:uncharacterized protein LOC125312689 [Rhodamnia argentea]|uniref:Uncharacterized protein LOC125312689 n=1 Tax=Rhodamnia argentea TaxID=178133 RepID=A0ABM3GU23_9MYRT|nr:uncharacterized protein LOC125312689 [Rhodamnia argentea]